MAYVEFREFSECTNNATNVFIPSSARLRLFAVIGCNGHTVFCRCPLAFRSNVYNKG